MGDKDKSRNQLLDELTELRQRVAELEKAENETRLTMESLGNSEARSRVDITKRKRAEGMLLDSEARYRTLFEVSADGILIADIETKTFKYANPALCRMLGYTQEELKTLGLANIHPKKDLPRVIAEFEAQAHGDKTLALDIPCLRKDGTIFFTDINTGAFTIDGKPYNVGFFRDISERKRAEEALRESERRLKEAQAMGRIGYWEYDPTNQKLVWSDQMFVLYERDPTLGAPNPEEEASYYSPEQRQIVQEYLMKALETGQNLQFDLQAKLFSGKMAYFAVTMHPIKNPNGRVVKMVGTVQDITERKYVEITLHKVNRSMKIIGECNSCLVRATDEKDFLNDVCQIIRKNGEYSMAWIGLLKAEENNILLPVAYAGSEPYDYTSGKIDLTDANGRYKILRTVITSGQFQVCQKLPDDRQPCFGPTAAADQPCRSIISLPLFFDNKTIGALTIYSSITDIFDENETKLLIELTEDVSYGIAALRTSVKHKHAEEQVKINLKKIENALEGTVKALAATSEMRDPYTAGHQRRVTQLACAIAQDMGLPQEQINAIRVAGLLHDIGKIKIPSEILTKPSKLTDVEFAIIKIHPKAAYDIIKSIDFPWPIARYILQHHEKLNGSGYPSGLKGDEILMESRILCVADIVEAMSSHRPYRPALGIDVALEDMLANKGVLYDPVVVDSCVKLFREKGFKFE